MLKNQEVGTWFGIVMDGLEHEKHTGQIQIIELVQFYLKIFLEHTQVRNYLKLRGNHDTTFLL